MIESPQADCPPVRLSDRHPLVPWMLAFLILSFLYFDTAKYRHDKPIDFPTYYWTAQVTFRQKASPYAADAFAAIEPAFGQTIYPVFTPPPTTLLFYPLAFLPYARAMYLMLGLNCACVLVLIYLYLVRIRGFAPVRVGWCLLPAVMAAYAACCWGSSLTIIAGQINLLVLVFICAAWDQLRRRGPGVLIGLFLGLAVLLKVYPILLVPVLLFRRRFGSVLWLAAVLAAVAAAAWLVLPRGMWHDWYYLVLPTGGYARTPYRLFTPAFTENQSINGFISRLFLDNEFTHPPYPSPLLARRLAYLLSGTVVAITLAVCYVTRRAAVTPGGEVPSEPHAPGATRSGGTGNLIDYEFAVLLLMMFMVGPLSWIHHLAYTIPACLLLIEVLCGCASRPVRVAAVAPSRATRLWPDRDAVLPPLASFAGGLAVLALALPTTLSLNLCSLPDHFRGGPQWVFLSVWCITMVVASARLLAVVVVWLLLLARMYRLAKPSSVAGGFERRLPDDRPAPLEPVS